MVELFRKIFGTPTPEEITDIENARSKALKSSARLKATMAGTEETAKNLPRRIEATIAQDEADWDEEKAAAAREREDAERQRQRERESWKK